MRILMLQINSRHDKAENISTISNMVDTALERDRPDLIVAPEYATFLGGTTKEQWAAGENFPDGEGYRAMQTIARKHKVVFHVGSMIETDGDKHFNTSVVFDTDGAEIAKYRKIHLFDVETPGGHIFRESDVIDRGDKIISYKMGKNQIGCSICYDLRFSELYLDHMRTGCNIIVVPAAFNLETGKDHWETMLRCRAIETQCFIIAPGQIGFHLEEAGERPCYGNSMVRDPWGTVIARAQGKPGTVIADLDLDYQKLVRTNLPSNTHHVL